MNLIRNLVGFAALSLALGTGAACGSASSAPLGGGPAPAGDEAGSDAATADSVTPPGSDGAPVPDPCSPSSGTPPDTLYEADGVSLGSLATNGSSVFVSAHHYDGAPNSVEKIPTAGGPAVRLAQGELPQAVISGASDVYWAEYGGVWTVPGAGGASRQLATVSSEEAPGPLVIDGGFLYWTSYFKGTLSRVALPAGGVTATITTVPLTDGQVVSTFAVRGSTAYLAVGPGDTYAHSSRLISVPIGGGPTKVLLSNLGFVTSVQTDSGHVYVADREEIWAVDVATGNPSKLLTSQKGVSSLLVDGATLYWATSETIERARTDGACASTVVSGLNKPWMLAFDATNLYAITATGDKHTSSIQRWKKW